MNPDDGDLSVDDALLEQFSQVSIPSDVERRLRGRMNEFYVKLETAPAGVALATRVAPSSRFSRVTRSYAAAGLAAALVLVAVAAMLGSRDAWAEVTKSLSSKRWVRLTLVVSKSQLDVGAQQVPAGFQPPETWFSAERRVAARRFTRGAAFIDMARQETFDFMPDRNTVWHSTTSDQETTELGHFERLLRLVSVGEQQLTRSDSPIEIIERRQREVRDGDRRLIEFKFHCRDPRQTPSDYETTIRIDPETKLPVDMSSNEKFPGFPEGPGRVLFYAFDYPETGPEDIYGLGVPRTAVVVDRRRAKTRELKEIKRFLAEFEKAQQKPIEPFSTLGLVTSSRTGSGRVIPSVLRAYRARIGAADSQPEAVKHEQPNGVDLNMFYPRAVTEFELADPERLRELNTDLWSKKVHVPDKLRAGWLKAKVAMLPFAAAARGQELLPHDVGYPVTLRTCIAQIEMPEIEFTLDKLPKSGPKGTVLLRAVTKTSLGFNDHRFWIAPGNDYMVLRDELHYSQKFEPWSNVTTIIDKVERSPGGRCYATQVRFGRVEKSGDDLSADNVLVISSAPDGDQRVRIEKAGTDDRTTDTTHVVKRNADGSENSNRPVTTAVYRFFVDF